MIRTLSFFILFLLFTSSVSLGEESPLIEIQQHYIKGDYASVLKKLDSLESDEKLKSLVAYWRGLTYGKLQKHRKAVGYFKDAYKLGNRAEDLHYLVGQSYYAAGRMSLAERAFERSIQSGFKAEESKQYIAHIKGEPLTRKGWELNFAQSIGYDSNVVIQAQDSIVQLSQTDAIVSRTGASGSYGYQLGSLRMTPELRTFFTLHSRRSVADVFQNDTVLGDFSLTTQVSQTRLKAKYHYMLRDYKQSKSLDYFSRGYSFRLSQQFTLLRDEASSIYLEYESYTNVDNDYSGKNYRLGLGHAFQFNALQTLILALEGNLFLAEADINDLTTYGFMVNWSNRALLSGYTLSPQFTFAMVDTKNQKATRGTEWIIKPGLDLSKKLNDWLTLSLSYSFLSRISQNKFAYDYDRHLAGITGQISL